MRRATPIWYLRLAPRCCRSSSTTPSAVPEQIPEQVHGGENKAKALKWALISGFNKFASRRDLQLVLGDAVPVKVETVLDAHSYFQGSWLVGFDDPDGEVQIRHIRSRLIAQRDKRPFPAAAVAEVTNAGTVSIRPVEYVPGTKVLKDTRTSFPIRLASEQGITGATVRLRNVRYNVAMDAIKFFLREFDLGPRGIEKMTIDPKLNQYLVHFSKPSEAEKAVHALNLKVANGNVMHLLWYQCC